MSPIYYTAPLIKRSLKGTLSIRELPTWRPRYRRASAAAPGPQTAAARRHKELLTSGAFVQRSQPKKSGFQLLRVL